MNSESEQRLSLEELKQRNRSQCVQMMTTPSAAPTKQDWEDLLTSVSALYRLERINSDRLERLEASVAAQEALFRALSRQVGQLPTQAQLEALARDVAQIQGCIETGWEEARDFYFAAQSGDSPLRADLADPDFAGDYGWDGGLADDLVRLGRTLERSSDPDPVRDATTISHYTDRKALRREREKKIALGHKVDDHEEEQIWEQKM